MAEADTNQNGAVDILEFMKLMKRTGVLAASHKSSKKDLTNVTQGIGEGKSVGHDISKAYELSPKGQKEELKEILDDSLQSQTRIV